MVAFAGQTFYSHLRLSIVVPLFALVISPIFSSPLLKEVSLGTRPMA